jgi:hypothetical protein
LDQSLPHEKIAIVHRLAIDIQPTNEGIENVNQTHANPWKSPGPDQEKFVQFSKDVQNQLPWMEQRFVGMLFARKVQGSLRRSFYFAHIPSVRGLTE